jgi:hypothetical protein
MLVRNLAPCQDYADPHARERALSAARQDPSFGISLDQAVWDALD